MKPRPLLCAAILIFLVGPAFGQIRHDNLLLVIDVSSTVSSRERLPQAAHLGWDLNRRLPEYVKKAGLLTFGNLNAPQLDWVVPFGPYDRQALDRALTNLQPGSGPTPLGAALAAAGRALHDETGRTALVIISDGRDNGVTEPVSQVRVLKATRGEKLCLFTIQLGDDPAGRDLLETLAGAGACGRALNASDLGKDAKVQALVDFIFPPAVRTSTDADHDGVPDDKDLCPRTPSEASIDDRGCWVIPDLHFEPGQSEIPAAQLPALDRVAQVLLAHPELVVAIEGHTDGQGSAESNQKLSEDRAAAVRNYLVDKGVDPLRMAAAGFGESRPVASDDTPEGMAQNRRIEIRVIR